jgi:hypothetical protein
MASKIQIISSAFVLLGANPVQNLLAGKNEREASLFYDMFLPDILCKHPWRFAMELRKLNRVNATPIIDKWQHIYQIPSDCLQILRIHAQTNYQIYQNVIYSNDLSITLEYTTQVNEGLFPAYFTKLMIYHIAEIMAMPLTQQPSLVQLWTTQARTQYMQAQFLDSQAKPNNEILNDIIWDSHRS